jgi:hypothetical protein
VTTLTLDEVIEEYAKGNQVNLPALAFMDFRDSPLHVWAGEYDITDPNGQVWTGLGSPGRLISIDGLEQAATLEAAQLTVTLSGADASVMAILADEDRGDYIGRLLIIYGMFCDRNWQPLVAPMALAAGIMGTVTVSRGWDDKQKAWVRKIILPADNIFYGRGGAPASFYTDRDQQTRFPGDTGLQYIPGLQDTSIPVPWKGY